MQSFQQQPSKPSLERIERLFGADVRAYVQRKNTGGASGQKGTLYEDIFAAHQLAVLARRFMETGENPDLESQACGFVDDFVVTYEEALRQKACQLKNSPSVSWSAGEHPIEQDFELQYKLATDLGFTNVELHLVTSSQECADKLTPAPDSIRRFSSAGFFPYREAIYPLLSEHRELREDFGFLSRSENCSLVESEQVASVLVGAWITSGRTGNVTSLIDRARSVSPTVIRPMRHDAEACQRLTEDVKMILDRIPGFTYSIVRGFLTWSAFGTEGVLGYDCFDARFSQFEATLRKKCPQTFDDIEGWLI